jgi:hypothetical protein
MRWPDAELLDHLFFVELIAVRRSADSGPAGCMTR